MNELDPKLGKLARDKVTGFEGIISVKGIHLYGCNTYILQPVVKDGKYEESRSFDEGRIEIIGDGIRPSDVQADKPGCEDIKSLERERAI